MSDEKHEPGSTATRTVSRAAGEHGVPAVGIGIGVLYLILGIARGQVGQGLIGLAIMLAYVALLLGLRRRSETAQLLNGRPTDERQAQVLLQASALTGQVLAAVLVGAFLVSLAADSRYTAVLSGLAAVTGVTFVAGTAWFSRRG